MRAKQCEHQKQMEDGREVNILVTGFGVSIALFQRRRRFPPGNWLSHSLVFFMPSIQLQDIMLKCMASFPKAMVAWQSLEAVISRPCAATPAFAL